MRIWILGIVASALSLTARPADACSCSAPGPACEIYWQNDAVFTGRVVATKDLPSKFGSMNEATIEVAQAFVGTLGKTVVVAGNGGCGYAFENGADYFVYARKSGGTYSTGACSGTKKLSDAGDDLAYAKHLPKRALGVVEGKLAIEGDVDRYGSVQMIPRAGAEVRARGTVHVARTDAGGNYRLEVVPGTYVLDVSDPGARVHGKNPTVAIPNGAACAKEDIIEDWDGRIRGRLVDHTGKPAAAITVAAHGVAGTRQRWRLEATTDKDGKYEITSVPPGSFVVAVGHAGDGGPDERQPIPPTYAPGVDTEAKAKVIAMKRSDLVQNIDFKLRAPLAVFQVSGVVRRNGKPLANAMVRIDNESYPRGTSAETDNAGRYSFKDVAGSQLVLELCRADANSSNYKTACKQTKRKLDRDLKVDLDMPP